MSSRTVDRLRATVSPTTAALTVCAFAMLAGAVMVASGVTIVVARYAGVYPGVAVAGAFFATYGYVGYRVVAVILGMSDDEPDGGYSYSE